MAYWGVVGNHVANVDCSQITEGFFEHLVDTYTYWACTMISQFVCVCVCLYKGISSNNDATNDDNCNSLFTKCSAFFQVHYLSSL